MSARFRLAVDAESLARDRRGMGRLTRSVLREAALDPYLALTLLCSRGRDARALAAEFPRARIRWPITAASRGAYHACWYPFNGIRFASAAPSLVTVHDVFAFTEPHAERVARYREQTPIRRAARDATRVLTQAHWTRREIVRELELPFERIDVLQPLPDPMWTPGEGDVLPRGIEGRRFALLVGVREARKNARTALEACARAFARSDAMLVVVGELSEGDRAFARAQGLACGEIAASDALLRALYRRATAVLVPSYAEGFGMVAMEALACGAAVIASNATALPEVVDGCATELDPRDTAGWARAIERVFGDPALERELRARALGRYDGTDRGRTARGTLAILRELATDATARLT